MDNTIDFVVTWVDSSDAIWNEKRSKFSDNKSNLNGESRFREYDLFKYWFRAVEKYAPWVNNIYLVTDRQTPKWLNKDHPKLKLVNHDVLLS